jgi:DNA-binding response OmpR family regulator
MLHLIERMPLVFVIARDWTLRTSVRAELRERGIDALGMDSPDDAGRAIASNQIPAVIVLEGPADLASYPSIRDLVSRIPTILIASRAERIPIVPGEEGSKPRLGAVLYRPVRVEEIVSRVLGFLQKGHAA